jgi:DNA (cytosine-5)-methyltransferase 1
MFEFPVGDATTISTVAGAIRGLPEPVFFQRGLTPEGIPYHPNHWTMRPKSKKFADGFLQEGQIKGDPSAFFLGMP